MRNFAFSMGCVLIASCAGGSDAITSAASKSKAAESTASDEDDDDDDVDEGDGDSAGEESASSEPSRASERSGVRSDAGPELCEARTIHADSVPPEVLIVLDKSASMALSRWNPSRAAVEMLVSEFDTQVAFGLSMFPAGTLGQCEAGQLDVPVELMNGDAITQEIDAVIPFGITPTAQTLENALKSLGDRNDVAADTGAGPPTYVLLVTDGEPNCADLMHLDPRQSAIDAVRALREANIKTFVIGYQLFGPGVALMNELAQAGDTEHYYPVENQNDLTEAFHDITKDIISCTFELSDVPPDPMYVRIVLDGKSVAINAADGWVIDGKVVSLQGTACRTLRDGMPHRLQSQVECEPVILL